MAEFESDTITIGALFSQDWFFRIPAYQRPFSWDDEHFDDLIVDTKDADRNSQYFLGTIVLHKEGRNTTSVVDGQQRLTSLLILLACLRDAIEDPEYKGDIQDKIMQQKRLLDGIPERARIEVKDRHVFNSVVVEKEGTLKKWDTKDYSISEKRYVTATEIFHQRIADLNQEQRQELVTFINRKCILIYVLADSFEQAFRLFEIVNDRGKQLRRIDVLKSKNISPEVIPQETVRNRIAQRWEEIENEVGENVFEATFFLVRLILLKDKPKADLLTEFEERIFKNGLVKKGEPFATLIFEYTKLYQDIFIDKTYIDTDDKFGIRYQSLIFIMNSEFQASEWRACLLSFARKFGREQFYLFCLAIEKLFLSQWAQGIRKDERYDAYSKILLSIETAKDAETVINSISFDKEEIIKAVTRNDVYHATFCKYALLRLELVTSEHDVPKYFTARSIEHVFPQTPQAGSKWLDSIEPGNTASFVHKIGNLVLISKGRNSAASNLDFDEKKKRYLKPRVSDYPRSNQVLGYSEWTEAVIQARTDEVARIFLDDP